MCGREDVGGQQSLERRVGIGHAGEVDGARNSTFAATLHYKFGAY